MILTTLILAGISLFSGNEWRTALAIGMILALSSTAIVLQTLEEKGLLKTQGGEASFSVLLVQDVAVIFILAVLPLLAAPELVAQAASHGGEAGHGPSLVAGLPAWLAGLVTLASVGLVVLLGTHLTRPIFRFIAHSIADINAKTTYKKTALMFACMADNTAFVSELLVWGANMHDVDSNGWTAMHYAARCSSATLCEELIDAGADVMQSLTFYASDDKLSYKGNDAADKYTVSEGIERQRYYQYER